MIERAILEKSRYGSGKPPPCSAPSELSQPKIREQIQHHAIFVALVHNHPSGDPKPSRDDIEMTCEIKAAAEALGISIHDYLMIDRKGHASFRSLGLL